MKKYEAIAFLNEIALTRPQILQCATIINLNETSAGTEITITSNFCSDDLQLITDLASAEGFTVSSNGDVIVIN